MSKNLLKFKIKESLIFLTIQNKRMTPKGKIEQENQLKSELTQA